MNVNRKQTGETQGQFRGQLAAAGLQGSRQQIGGPGQDRGVLDRRVWSSILPGYQSSFLVWLPLCQPIPNWSLTSNLYFFPMFVVFFKKTYLPYMFYICVHQVQGA